MNEKELKPIGMLTGDKWDKMHDISRRVYDEDGVCPTIPTGAGGNTEVKILVREATKKGYAEAEPGDSINLAQPNSKTRRGRVGKQVAQTITCNPEQYVIAEEQTDDASDIKERFFRQAIETLHANDCQPGDTIDAFNKRVNKTGISPTITTRPEGFKTAILVVQDEPRAGAIRGRNPDNPSDRTPGIPTVQMLEMRDDECTNAITTVQKDNVIVMGDKAGEVIIDGKRYVVRKLTPRECWRLFGFTDEQFNTAKDALNQKHYKGRDRSSSQLYKQAGNTIAIPMLEAVMRQIRGIATAQ